MEGGRVTGSVSIKTQILVTDSDEGILYPVGDDLERITSDEVDRLVGELSLAGAEGNSALEILVGDALAQPCAGISGEYTHGTHDYSPGIVPVSWGVSADGEAAFRKSGALTIEAAAEMLRLPTQVVQSTGWVLCIDGAPAVELPFEFMELERWDALVSVREVLSSGTVTLERRIPGVGAEEAYHSSFAVRIPIIGDRTPREALNLKSGILPRFQGSRRRKLGAWVRPVSAGQLAG